jgi:phenylpropionate dioxygenase-like ring-hydroxylating dioxygenase large terminal subunit
MSAAALLDSCAHRGAPLSLGTVVAQGIRCNYHGVVFAASGVCAAIPNHRRRRPWEIRAGTLIGGICSRAR